MARVLERAHALERDRAADVDVRRGDVDAELHPQRPARASSFALEPALPAGRRRRCASAAAMLVRHRARFYWRGRNRRQSVPPPLAPFRRIGRTGSRAGANQSRDDSRLERVVALPRVSMARELAHLSDEASLALVARSEEPALAELYDRFGARRLRARAARAARRGAGAGRGAGRVPHGLAHSAARFVAERGARARGS